MKRETTFFSRYSYRNPLKLQNDSNYVKSNMIEGGQKANLSKKFAGNTQFRCVPVPSWLNFRSARLTFCVINVFSRFLLVYNIL